MRLTTITIVLLLFSSQANANYRKALDAMLRAQGTEMLVEVEQAVKSKNTDGLSLFLGTLGRQIKDGEFYLKRKTQKQSFINDNYNEFQLILAKNNIPELLSLLEQAIKSEDIATKFEFFVLKKRLLLTSKQRSNFTIEELKDYANQGSIHALRMLEGITQHAIFYGKEKRNLEDDLKWLEKSALAGNINSAAWLASIYLYWPNYYYIDPSLSKFKAFKNAKKGVHWLKYHASNDNYSYSACRLADAYYAGDIIQQDINQAYLWYMESAFRSGYPEDCTLFGLRNMAYSGDLEHLNEELTELVKKDEVQNLRMYFKNVNGQFVAPKEIQQFKAKPEPGLAYSVQENRYNLNIYHDGTVKYEGFDGFNDRVSGYIIGRDEWKIPAEQVKLLLKQLKQARAFEGQLYITEGVLCDTGEIWRNGHILIDNNGEFKKIHYSTIRHIFHTPILAKIFKIQESIIPTQHLRCGPPRKDNDYKNCVAEDEYNFKNADKIQPM